MTMRLVLLSINVANKNKHWRDGYGVYGLPKKEWSEL